MFSFFKLLINKRQGGSEFKIFFKRIVFFFPMLLFLFSRVYGYAKARMLNFNGILNFSGMLMIFSTDINIFLDDFE